MLCFGSRIEPHFLASKWQQHIFIRAIRYKGSTNGPYSLTRQLATRRKAPTSFKSYESPAQRLAKKGPTLLYDCGSNAPYIFGCYFIGFSIIGCAIINNHTKGLAEASHQKNDVPAYVPLFTAIGVAALFGFGSYMCLRPQNMIRSIKTIPSNEPGLRPLVFQIERTRSIPFIKPKTATVSPSDVTMSEPLFIGGDEQVRLELKELQRRKDRETAFARDDYLAMPFKQAGYWFGSWFLAVKKAFLNTGVIQFHVRGKNISWKLERDRAWSLEDGRYLDTLVNIKQV